MNIHFISSNVDEAKKDKEKYISIFGQSSIEDADVIVVLSGDGAILDAMHRILNKNINTPIYGINYGTIGFLLNEKQNDLYDNLLSRIANAFTVDIAPLQVEITQQNSNIIHSYAINDVYLNRASNQSCRLDVYVDDIKRIEGFSGDGIILSSEVGSTAYNRSAGGPIIPIGSGLLALTPICSSYPRHWSGALLPQTSIIRLEVLDETKRKVIVVADNKEIKDPKYIKISQASTPKLKLMFDKESTLHEKIIKEQF